MQRRSWIRLAALLAIVTLLVPACSRNAEPDAAGDPAAWPPASAEPTVPADPQAGPASPNEGLPIVDLANKTAAGDDADREALLSVAHSATGIAEDFYVWQLLVQGTSAVGDLQGSASGERKLVAFERDGYAWRATYQVRFLDASEAALREASALVTAELAERVEFVVPVDVDPYFERVAAALVTGGRANGIADMGVYAPTRLPEGFALSGTEGAEGAFSAARYSAGDKALEYTIITGSDYGEVTPRATYTRLRFGDLRAEMDASFRFSEWVGEGVHLHTFERGEHYLSARGVSPGMVAAVAESMVRVR